jgi:hypothetical protein
MMGMVSEKHTSQFKGKIPGKNILKNLFTLPKEQSGSKKKVPSIFNKLPENFKIVTKPLVN